MSTQRQQLYQVKNVDKKFLLLAFVIATFACITATQPTTETQLSVFQGLGVTYFGVPTIGGQTPSFSVQRIRPSEEAYLSMIIRNNAGGDKAEDLVVSLDNVKPFKMVECGEEHTETEIRTDEQAQCVSWLDNINKPFRSFGIPSIAPGEEVELIYVLKAPSKNQVANVYYEHEIFYTMQYKYKTSAFQSIVGFSQEEYSNQVKSGTLSQLNQTNTAGAVNIKSKIKSPVIYTLGKDKDFLLEFELSNVGIGNLVTGSKINVTVTYPTSVVPNLALGTGGDTVLDLNECNGATGLSAGIVAKEPVWNKKLSFAVIECTVNSDCGAKCIDGVLYSSGTCASAQCSYSGGTACESGFCRDETACLDTSIIINECSTDAECAGSCQSGTYYAPKCVSGTCEIGSGSACASGVCEGDVCKFECVSDTDCGAKCTAGVYYKGGSCSAGLCSYSGGENCESGVCSGNECKRATTIAPTTSPEPEPLPLIDSATCNWFTEEYDAGTERVLMIQLNSVDLTSARTIVLPFTLKQTNAPIVSAPFFIRSSYIYGNEGSAKIGVSPVK